MSMRNLVRLRFLDSVVKLWLVSSDKTKINKAELVAINIAVDMLLDHKISDRKILIVTDSLEALNELNRDYTTQSSTLDCVKSLNKLGSLNLLVVVKWFPKNAHIDVMVEADKLAKMSLQQMSVPFKVLPDKAAFKELTNTWKKREMQRYWDSKQIRDSKIMIEGPSDNRLVNFPKFNKSDFRLLTGVLSGHLALKEKLFQMKKAPNKFCRLCKKPPGLEKPENIIHLLTDCCNLKLLGCRKKYLGEYFPTASKLKFYTFSKLIKFVKKSGIAELLNKYPP